MEEYGEVEVVHDRTMYIACPAVLSMVGETS